MQMHGYARALVQSMSVCSPDRSGSLLFALDRKDIGDAGGPR